MKQCTLISYSAFFFFSLSNSSVENSELVRAVPLLGELQLWSVKPLRVKVELHLSIAILFSKLGSSLSLLLFISSLTNLFLFIASPILVALFPKIFAAFPVRFRFLIVSSLFCKIQQASRSASSSTFIRHSILSFTLFLFFQLFSLFLGTSASQLSLSSDSSILFFLLFRSCHAFAQAFQPTCFSIFLSELLIFFVRRMDVFTSLLVWNSEARVQLEKHSSILVDPHGVGPLPLGLYFPTVMNLIIFIFYFTE